MDTQLRARLADAFQWIDPGPQSTHLVSDRSGWWRDPLILCDLGPALARLFADDPPSVVVSPEVTGFLVGPLVAAALGVGFVEAVKDGRERRLAEPIRWATTAADYRGRRSRLGVRARHLHPGDRVLVVDDWVGTGAQVSALYEVIGTAAARPVGTAAIVAQCSPDVAARLRVRCLLSGVDLPP